MPIQDNINNNNIVIKKYTMPASDKRQGADEKKFVVRNSLLTDIFEDNKTRNTYNVYVIVFTGFMVQTAAKQYIQQGSVDFGLATITTGFAKLDRALLIWLCCLGSACASFFFFKVWSNLRNFDRRATTIWDWFWTTTLITYYFYSFKTTTTAITYFKFNPPCATFVSIESVRILMKVHSFVRNSVPQVIYTTGTPAPKFSNFLYFLFAPTLIYRDNYPLTKNINWGYVGRRCLESLSVLFIFTFLLEAVYPSPQRWLQKFTVSETLLLIVQCMPHGVLTLMGVSFLIFHSVQNLFAEVTRFGDRLFYLDWWNTCNLNTFITRWNKLVQDWLYYYIYCDFKVYVCSSTVLARFVVFFISFAVHEWVIYCWLGKFFPFMFIIVTTIVIPTFYVRLPESVVSNAILWCASGFLTSALSVLCMFEYYAVINAPLTDPSFWEVLFPRFLTCDCVLLD